MRRRRCATIRFCAPGILSKQAPHDPDRPSRSSIPSATGSCRTTKRYPRNNQMSASAVWSPAAASQLRPIFQTLADLALETTLGRIVEGLPPQAFRKIILAGKAFCRVVVGFVAFALAFRLH